MSTSELDRWKDFSYRMARTHYAKRQNPDLKWIESNLDFFFAEIGSDADLYKSWDGVEPYPPNHPNYNPSVSQWLNCPPCACDILSGVVDDIWYQAEQHATDRELKLLDYYWERGDTDEYEAIKEKIMERWEEPLSCCIRSGMDLAFEQSAGVVGFTAGDVQKMYPEGLPKWVDGLYSLPISEMNENTRILL
jgi:hypothetical protein